jgi:hypothetical protein
MSDPGLSADFLPENMRKHVNPGSPLPLRMMAAKTLVPLSPSDMVGALYLLTFDPDAQVKDAAEKSVDKLPDKILTGALRDEDVPAPVLGYFLQRLAAKDAYAQMLILNPSTPDAAVAHVAKECSPATAEIIAQNQLRVLRHDEIVRSLCQNPNVTPALVDGVCDFCVRSGMNLADVPAMTAARVRLFGPEAVQAPQNPGPTAEEVMAEHSELTEESAAPIEEQKRLTLAQKVMRMSISEKIKLATRGNKEARGILIRDSNKLVCVAVIRSPRITDGEVLSVANNRAAQEDVLRVVYTKREFVKLYPVKLALVKNPKVPLTVSMKFLSVLRESDVKDLARNKNIPSGVQGLAKKMMEKKNAPKKTEGK